MGDVIELGPHSNMTAQEALAIVTRQKPDNIAILYFEDSPQGESVVLTLSSMTNAELLWALERAKIETLGA